MAILILRPRVPVLLIPSTLPTHIIKGMADPRLRVAFTASINCSKTFFAVAGGLLEKGK
jgi:hypothetical protein